MSTPNSRDAIARGDMAVWLATMSPDEIDTLTIPLPGIGDGTTTFARIGCTQVAVRHPSSKDEDDGEVRVHVHDTEDSARQCFAANRERMQRVRDAIPQGPMALLLALADVTGLTDEAVPVPATASLPRRNPGASIREVAAELPTGQYL